VPASGAGRLTVDLGGRWERAADESAPTSFPDPGVRARAGVPDALSWRKLVVPDNFGSDDEFSAHFGPMWYRRRFADPWAGAEDQPPGRIRLRFLAVDYLADVWLNGEHLGHHEGAFAPFGFDVTDRLRRDNEVVVCVQDPLEPLDPSAYFFAHRKRVIKGTLKYHDSRPGGLPGRMTGPLAEGSDPWVWTPERDLAFESGTNRADLRTRSTFKFRVGEFVKFFAAGNGLPQNVRVVQRRPYALARRCDFVFARHVHADLTPNSCYRSLWKRCRSSTSVAKLRRGCAPWSIACCG
jgi:hypothetical protein